MQMPEQAEPSTPPRPLPSLLTGHAEVGAHANKAHKDTSLRAPVPSASVGVEVGTRVLEAEEDREQQLKETPEELPSLGSAMHASGSCSRCCFFLKGRCRNGADCRFCHFRHEKRSRGRGCRGHGAVGKTPVGTAGGATEVDTPAMTAPTEVKVPGAFAIPPGLDALAVPPTPSAAGIPPPPGLLPRAAEAHGQGPLFATAPPTPSTSSSTPQRVMPLCDEGGSTAMTGVAIPRTSLSLHGGSVLFATPAPSGHVAVVSAAVPPAVPLSDPWPVQAAAQAQVMLSTAAPSAPPRLPTPMATEADARAVAVAAAMSTSRALWPRAPAALPGKSKAKGGAARRE